jgi:uncharacterized repeat protein (TIGR03803 family)
MVDPAFDHTGNLYGTTYLGGSGEGAGGVVFLLSPFNSEWTESVIYAFSGTDHPYSGVAFDAAGDLYGTTSNGGRYAFGDVFQLALPSGGAYAGLYDYKGDADGAVPVGGLIVDGAGQLYGTTSTNRFFNGGGTVFELSFGSPWMFILLTGLSGDGGGGPLGNLAMDSEGNLYGTTFADGAHDFGSVFKLTRLDGGWMYSTLHDFTNGDDGGLPVGGPVLDASGNLYGTTTTGGRREGNCPPNGCGVIWKIVR